MQELAQCFIMTYVMINSEKSPTDKIVLLEPQSLPEVYLEYKKYFSEINCCKQSTFEELWYQQIRLPLPDPVANVFYTIKRRKRAKCGFKRCDTCCELQFNIYAAKGTTAKQEARDAYQAHVDSYTADRRELGHGAQRRHSLRRRNNGRVAVAHTASTTKSAAITSSNRVN